MITQFGTKGFFAFWPQVQTYRSTELLDTIFPRVFRTK